MSTENIWIPDIASTLEECVFFSVEIRDGSCLSKDEYAALFFHKLVTMIDHSVDDDLIENLNVYLPYVFERSEDLSSADIALRLVNSDEFYYGFPPIDDDEISCTNLEEKAEEEIDMLEKEEFLDCFEEEYNFYTVLRYVTTLHDEFLTRNSDHILDR